MYAIIRQGGKQYRIAPGEELICDKVRGNVGDPVGFDKILLVNEDDKTIVVPEELAKYNIEAELAENFADDKILVFKYRAKKGYRRTTGHRQLKSKIKIISIGAGKPKTKTKKVVEEKAPAAKKAAPAKTKNAATAAKPKKTTVSTDAQKKTAEAS